MDAPGERICGGERLVSCIIVMRNGEKFLQEAIDSVFAQTYSTWELLIADDGSTDGATEIARECARRYPHRVRYLEHDGHENRGTSVTRNLGIRNAKGEYIAFLDVDDVWLPRKLEQQVSILELNPEAAVVWGPPLFWLSWNGDPEDVDRDFIPLPPVELDTVTPAPRLVGPCLGPTCSALPSGALIRTKVLLANGGCEEQFRNVFEDRVLFVKIYLTEPVFVSRECWFKYRIHRESVVSSSQKTGYYYLARKMFVTWLRDYMVQQNTEDAEAWRALRQMEWPFRHPFLHAIENASRGVLFQLKGLAKRLFFTAIKLKANASWNRKGTLAATPNPVSVPADYAYRFGMAGATEVSWNIRNVEAVEVRVGAPNGPLFSRSTTAGKVKTGYWIYDGTVFFLQDVSGGKPLSLSNTLDVLRIHLNHT
jgi:glycosyltransferase involved in cell wall biosynthesis